MQQSSIIKPGTTPVRFGDALYVDRTLHSLTATGQPMELFKVTATITSAAAATAVNVIPEAAVGTGRKVYLQGYIARVNGTTGWGTTATVKLQDTNGTAVDFVTWAVAGMTNQARLVPGSANTTLENAYSLGSGGTAGKGLQLIGDANGTGSDFVVTCWGWIA